MSNEYDIAVIGSINLDFVIRTRTLPTAGETVGGGEFMTTPGGKGANQALAARRLGARTQLFGCVGKDPYAGEALSNLKNEGVDLSGVATTAEELTGAAFINVDDKGENQIAVASGANKVVSAASIGEINAKWIIAQLEVSPDAVLAGASKSGAKLCLNAAPARELDDKLFERADVVVVNEVEWEFYKDQLSTFSGDVVLTLGAKGAVVMRDGEEVARAAPPVVDVVDTTGAGDTFVAGFVTGLIEGMSLDDSLNFACRCGALSTTKLGAQSGIPTRDHVRELA